MEYDPERDDWFVPIFRDVADWVGLGAASVFGCVWFMSFWKDKCCHAALATIAEATGQNMRSVRRHIRTLEEAQLIACVGLEAGHTPRSYVPSYVPLMMRPEALARREARRAKSGKKSPDILSALLEEARTF